MIKKFLLFAALGIAFPLKAADFSDTLKQGLECQKQGLLNQAVVKLEKAKLVAQSADEQTQISGALGRTYYQFHQYELAKPLLEKAYQNSGGLQKADYANLLGNLHARFVLRLRGRCAEVWCHDDLGQRTQW